MTSRILIVDNDPALLDWYSEGLSDAHRIVTARAGQAAVERVKRKSDIDLAVIDYLLPDMTGVDAMKEIKDLAPSVPVIIVTAYGDEETAVEAFRSGARDYLKKPLCLSELCSKIDFYLALRRADKKRRKNIVPAADAAAATPSAVPLSQYHKVQRAVRFINDNYGTDIRLDGAAREAGMSRSHFSRIFRKVMGLSYQDYLNSLRIAKARNLLRTTPRTVTDIALSLGFADATGFGRIFKKLTGHTPSACRSLPEKVIFSHKKA